MWLGGQHTSTAVGPRAVLNGCGGEKISCPPPGFEPRTAQPVASRSTVQRNKNQRTIKIPSLGNPKNFFPFVPLVASDVITQIGGRQTHVVEDALM